MKHKLLITVLILTTLLSLIISCTSDQNGSGKGTQIESWLTKADQSVLLQKQAAILSFSDSVNSNSTISIDSSKFLQTVDGFGYTLTGGSATLINKLPAEQKKELLQELFGKNENSISISYLRISIGASDLSADVFSYNDIQAGQTDTSLKYFSLSKDTVDLVPLLKEILAIDPTIKIMGSPWSPPVWMKDNGNSKGGSLLPKYYSVYAQYFVKYVQVMMENGIRIDAITPQNEPQHGGNNPSMVMSAEQQADFIKNNLGPAFKTAGIITKIIIWDHNCDNPNYPITILNDPAAKQYIDGSAFHLYNGDISALDTVHNLHPDKNLYFTEQWTGTKGSFDGDLKWHTRNVIIGSMRNWSKIALEWNLASDSSYNPHTPGGCTECKGALTINGDIKRNVGYYIVAHASKFVPPGSVVMASNIPENDLPNVSFITPGGKKVLIVLNDGATNKNFNIKYQNKIARVSLPANSVASYVW